MFRTITKNRKIAHVMGPLMLEKADSNVLVDVGDGGVSLSALMLVPRIGFDFWCC